VTFVKSWTEGEGRAYIIQGSGGGAVSPGPSHLNRAQPQNPWSRKHWSMTRQGQLYRMDPVAAERMARAAGHQSASAARLANAK